MTPPRAALRAIVVAVATITILQSIAGLAMAQSGDRGLLWRVVQLCVANARITGASFPCLDVNLSNGVAGGFAVVRAPLEATHIVLVPTARVQGVESKGLDEADSPNYMADAWQARRFVEARATVPLKRDDFGLAINSRPGRSQDQLHIHVDCLQASARDALRSHAAEIHTEAWSRLPFDLHGDRYSAIKLKSPDLRDVNVFQMVTNGLHVSEADRPRVTIVLAGASFEKGDSGFYLLAAVAARGHHQTQGHGEFLLDHTCSGL